MVTAAMKLEDACSLAEKAMTNLDSIRTPVFTAGLFTAARTWQQPRCPATDEYIRKLWYTYIIEYYPAIKRNAFESVLKRWMNLELITE